MLLGGEELHLVAMASRKNDGRCLCFWGFNVALGLYNSCLVMLNLRCLGIVFDLDETLIVANTMCSSILQDALPPKELNPAEKHCKVTDAVLCLGTSLQITPACNLPLKSLRGGGKFVIASLQVFPCVSATCGHKTSSLLLKRLYIHPPDASRVLLPDGRHLAYQDQGVPGDRARFSIIGTHPFLSSRLAGIPGLRASLLQEFGICLVTYDLPGFGLSDPHPNRNLESLAMDMLQLSYAVGVTDKFWVVGYSGGSMHAWAALRYIPDRVVGAVMVAPMVNPFEPSMTKKERYRSWGNWTPRRKLMYFLARRFPSVLAYFYQRSFLSGNHGQIDKWLSLSLGKRDRTLIEEPMFKEFWQRDVEESVRQRNVKPFVEEAVLLVSDWGFRLSDLNIQKKRKEKASPFGLILCTARQKKN